MKTFNAKAVVVLMTMMAVCACGQPKASPKPKRPSEEYIDAQLKVIEAHRKLLADEGRMPADFDDSQHYLAEYGWRSEGSWFFGAYTFSTRAFEQAKKQWWIDGIMEKGKDLLYPMNRNASFDPSVVGHRVDYIYGENLNATVLAVDGETYEWQSWGSGGTTMHGKKIWRGPLKLSKAYPDDGKEPRFVITYGIFIEATDYVDMCGCTSGGSPFSGTK